MVSLSNVQRLLAAQAFNRQVIARKLAEGKRVSTSRFGVLTGRVARVDPRTKRVTGITKTRSATRLQTDRQLRAEIKRQEQVRSKESDLERFLKNERTLSSGRLSLSQIKRQIAARKARGLSKTPAQRAALKRAQGRADTTALALRAQRKRGRGIRPSLIQSPSRIRAIQRTEESRAEGLGSSIFTDPQFQFGGRTRKEVIARGGTFGRRVAGETFSSQLGFVRGARIGTSTARIGLAKSLLGNPFEGASSRTLLGVTGARTRQQIERLTPPTFEQVLRKGVGFFDTEPVSIVSAPRASGRRALVRARKTEDLIKAREARREVARGAPRDDFERIFVLGSQVRERKTRLTKKGIDPLERLILAQQTQRETEAIRAAPRGQPAPLTQATGLPRSTQTFSPALFDTGRQSRQFDVTLSETIGISDSARAKVRRPKGAKRPKRPQAQRETITPLGFKAIEPAPTPRPTTTRPTRQGSFLDNIFGGLFSTELAPDVTVGQATERAGSLFDFSNIFGAGERLAGGTLIEGRGIGGEPIRITTAQAARGSPVSGLFDFFSFLGR